MRASRDNDEALAATIYDELRRIASRHMAQQAPDHSLQPTALVHEAYLRLADAEGVADQSKTHFCVLASKVMRQVLVDHARARRAAKRGGDALRTNLSGLGVPAEDRLSFMDVHEALEDLARLDPERARLVELRFLGGLTEAEAAQELGVSRASITREWRFIRAWLSRRLSGDVGGYAE